MEHDRARQHLNRNSLLPCQMQALHMPWRVVGGFEAAEDTWQHSSRVPLIGDSVMELWGPSAGTAQHLSSIPSSCECDMLLGGQVLALHMSARVYVG